MPEKKVQILTFMTRQDELAFSEVLIGRFKKLRFIDGVIWPILPPQSPDSIAACGFDTAIVLNEDILSFSEYSEKYTRRHPSGVNYMGAQVGSGMIQFLRSKEIEGRLSNGRLAATYDSADSTMSDYVMGVWSAFRNRSVKIYQVDQQSGSISTRAEGKFFAWPNAAATYDGREEHFLTSSPFHYYIAKRP